MTEITSLNKSAATQRVAPPLGKRAVFDTQDSAPAPQAGDTIALSTEAIALDLLRNNGVEIRQDLVNRVREEIANGTYDTPDKFEAALDQLLSDFNI